MRDLKNPDQIYRGTDFWMLNDRLDKAEIQKQIEKMHEQGVSSFIARTYIGLKSDYPGADFMEKTSLMISEAKKYGMTVFLQAGYMPEAVLDLPPEYALDYLTVYPEGAMPEGERILSRKDGKAYCAKNSVTLLNMFSKKAIAFYIHQSYDLWQPFSAEFGKTVLSVWVDEPSYHEGYLPWADCIDRAFTEQYGYDIKPCLSDLYEDSETSKTTRYRYWTLLQKMMEEAYFSMIRDWCNRNGLWFSGHLMMEDTLFDQILRACATMPYYKYFDIPGIDCLCGRMEWRENPITRTFYNDNMMYTTPLQCVSAAHQAGKNHVLCEMYGVTTNGMGFRDYIHFFEHFASLGVNHRSVHGMFYSLHGRAKRQYPPHVNYYQPYWEAYRTVTDTCARISSFLSEGAPVANVLVLHPLETAYCMFEGGRRFGNPPQQLAEFDRFFASLTRNLLASHICFELGDIHTIATGHGKAENGKFYVGQMAYDTVILPKLSVLNRETAELLKAFSEQGGTVFVLEHYPDMLDGEATDVRNLYLQKAEHVSGFGALCQRLAQSRLYQIEGEENSASIRVYHTKTETEQFFMLFHTDCGKSQNAVLTVPGKWRVETADPVEGTVSACPAELTEDATRIFVKLEEGGSVLLHLQKGEKAEQKPVPEKQPAVLQKRIDSDFHIERNAPNVMVLEFCSYRTEQMTEFQGPYTVLAVNRILTDADYRGQLTQRFVFRADRACSGLSLALEDAAQCQVFLNGVKAESYDGASYYLAPAFETVSLPDACRTGENVIEIRRMFTPLSKAKSSITSLFECQLGTELESMYLLGDFGVFGSREYSMSGLNRYSRDTFLSAEAEIVSGELTQKGYLFYAGEITLSKTFRAEPTEGRAYLSFGAFYGAVAEVIVNGKSVGQVFRPPYRVEITEAVQEGENELKIRLYNTLRPILGPFHRPLGEIGECWGGYEDADMSWTNSACGKDWYQHTWADSDTWTDSYLQPKFGVWDMEIIVESFKKM